MSGPYSPPHHSWRPAHPINPNAPNELFWFYMITYGTMGILAGLVLAWAVWG